MDMLQSYTKPAYSKIWNSYLVYMWEYIDFSQIKK